MHEERIDDVTRSENRAEIRPLRRRPRHCRAARRLAETVTLRFVQTNDIDRMEEHDGRGGFAKLAAVVEARARRRARPSSSIPATRISPSLLSGIDKGAHQIDILNQMGVDVMTPGNHEFDFGPDIFRTRIGEAKFPIVTSNVREAGRQPAGQHGRRRRSSRSTDVKIGFYGLTTEDTPDVVVARRHHLRRRGRHGARQGRRRCARRGRRLRRRRRPHAASPRTWRWRAKARRSRPLRPRRASAAPSTTAGPR